MGQNIGDKIKELRLNKSLTQTGLAKDIINRSYLSQIESGKVIPSVHILEELSKRLDCSVEDFSKPLEKKLNSSLSFKKLLKMAEADINSSEIENAKKHIDQVDINSFSNKDFHEYGVYHWVLGEIYKNFGELGRAEKYIRKSIEDFSEINNQNELIRSYNSLANILSRVGDHELEILSFMNYCYELTLDYKISNHLKTETQLNLGIVHGKLTEYQSSLRYLKMALEHNKKSSNYYKHGNILMALGICLKNIEDNDGSEKYYKDALKFFEITNDLSNIAGTFVNLGILYREKNVFDMSISHLEKAVEIYEQKNDFSDQVYAKYQLSKTLYLSKELTKGEQIAIRLLELHTNIEDKLLILLGDIYFEKSLYEEAVAFYLKAKRIHNSTDLHKRLGVVYYRMAMYRESADYLYKSIKSETPT